MKIYPITRAQLARVRRLERQRAALIATAARLVAMLDTTGWTDDARQPQGALYWAYADLRRAVQDAIVTDGET